MGWKYTNPDGTVIIKDGEAVSRTVLVHLNVTTPATDKRSANEIANAILRTLWNNEIHWGPDSIVIAPLAEDV